MNQWNEPHRTGKKLKHVERNILEEKENLESDTSCEDQQVNGLGSKN